jgi:hypothetical protein
MNLIGFDGQAWANAELAKGKVVAAAAPVSSSRRRER